jgi:hypothetical protein
VAGDAIAMVNCADASRTNGGGMKIRYQAFWFILLGSISLPTFRQGVEQQIDALQKAVARLTVADGKLQLQIAALAASNNALSQQVATLNAANATLAQQINGISANSVLALDGKLALGPDRRSALFTGVNVQITNGAGSTETINGLGNLIVGYDEDNLGSQPPGLFSPPTPVCSDGTYTNQFTCENAGLVWANNQHTGSHNLVIGWGHTYTSYGGLVAGFSNAVNRASASASGGAYGTASGPYSSVSGGSWNTANAESSSVSGGQSNTASWLNASVSGGIYNTASQANSSVSGGFQNSASGPDSSVSGGQINNAIGVASSITGGEGNTTSGQVSSVSSGRENTAAAYYSIVTGGYRNTASGQYSSVSGGSGVTQPTDYSWAAGTLTSP